MASINSQLDGQVALVTGGGTGIGLMIAKAFANNGAKVYITGRRLQVLKDAIASSGVVTGSFVPLQLDVVDEDAAKGVAKFIEYTDGKLDILVNNAGINGPIRKIGVNESVRDTGKQWLAQKLAAADPTEPEALNDWVDMFKLNTIAPFFITRAFKKLLIKGAEARGGTSSVINISSCAAEAKSPITSNSLGYGATKAALDQLTVTLATLFASTGVPIRVNGIAPGLFPSEVLLETDFLDDVATLVFPGFVKPIPAKRAGTEEEMGATALYLATTEYTNGITLKINGGILLVNP